MSASAQMEQVIKSGLQSVKERAESIVVRTAQDYIAVCNIVVEGRGFIKRWEEVFAPGIRSATETLNVLRNEKNQRIEEAKSVVAIAEAKAEQFKREERAAAQREQEEINRKAREEQERLNKIAEEQARRAHKKIPDPPAIVEPIAVVTPNVPKVSGIRARVNWKFRIKDVTKIPQRYLIPNDVLIGQVVRSTASELKKLPDADIKNGIEHEIPGIEVFCEDSI